MVKLRDLLVSFFSSHRFGITAIILVILLALGVFSYVKERSNLESQKFGDTDSVAKHLSQALRLEGVIDKLNLKKAEALRSSTADDKTKNQTIEYVTSDLERVTGAPDRYSESDIPQLKKTIASNLKIAENTLRKAKSKSSDESETEYSLTWLSESLRDAKKAARMQNSKVAAIPELTVVNIITELACLSSSFDQICSATDDDSRSQYLADAKLHATSTKQAYNALIESYVALIKTSEDANVDPREQLSQDDLEPPELTDILSALDEGGRFIEYARNNDDPRYNLDDALAGSSYTIQNKFAPYYCRAYRICDSFRELQTETISNAQSRLNDYLETRDGLDRNSVD